MWACLWCERATTSVWPPKPWQGKRPSLTAVFRTHRSPMVVRSPLCIRSSSLGSPHFLTHKPTQTAEVSVRAAQGAVKQHWCCERPTLSFQSTDRVSELPRWFVAWLLLPISLEITAGGGPQPGSLHSSISSPPLRKQREKNKSLPPSHTAVIGLQAILLPAELSMTIQGALQLWYLPQKFTSAFFFPLFFLNNAISTANYTFHITHYSLPWRQTHSSPTHFTSGPLHAGISPGSPCSTASFSH